MGFTPVEVTTSCTNSPRSRSSAGSGRDGGVKSSRCETWNEAGSSSRPRTRAVSDAEPSPPARSAPCPETARGGSRADISSRRAKSTRSTSSDRSTRGSAGRSVTVSAPDTVAPLVSTRQLGSRS